MLSRALTLLQWLDRFPPRLCRLVATDRTGKRALTTRELSARSGLGLGTVARLSLRDTWAGSTIETVQAFATACGVDHFHLAGKIKFLKRGRWGHTTRSRPGNHARSYFKRLLTVK